MATIAEPKDLTDVAQNAIDSGFVYATAEQYADFDRYLYQLRSRDIWYAEFLNALHCELTHEVPTAAVSVRHGEIVLLINYKFFFETLKNDAQRDFIIRHEIQHVMRGHLFIIREYPHLQPVVNFIADALINESLIEEGKLVGDTVPPDGIHYSTFQEMARKTYDAMRKDGKTISQWDASIPVDTFLHNWSTEQLIQFLPPSEDSCPAGQEIWEIHEARHGEHGEMCTDDETNREYQEELVRQAVDRATSQAGKAPANLSDVINKLYDRTSRDWKGILRAAANTARIDLAQSRLRQFNKKRPWITRGRRFLPRPRVICGVDRSGSTCLAWPIFLAEIQNCTQYFDLDMAFFDVGFDPEDPKQLFRNVSEGKVWDTISEGIVGGGGTDFTAFYEWMLESKQQKSYDALILFTDGDINNRGFKQKVIRGLARRGFALLTQPHNTRFREEAEALGWRTAIIEMPKS